MFANARGSQATVSLLKEKVAYPQCRAKLSYRVQPGLSAVKAAFDDPRAPAYQTGSASTRACCLIPQLEAFGACWGSKPSPKRPC